MKVTNLQRPNDITFQKYYTFRGDQLPPKRSGKEAPRNTSGAGAKLNTIRSRSSEDQSFNSAFTLDQEEVMSTISRVEATMNDLLPFWRNLGHKRILFYRALNPDIKVSDLRKRATPTAGASLDVLLRQLCNSDLDIETDIPIKESATIKIGSKTDEALIGLIRQEVGDPKQLAGRVDHAFNNPDDMSKDGFLATATRILKNMTGQQQDTSELLTVFDSIILNPLTVLIVTEESSRDTPSIANLFASGIGKSGDMGKAYIPIMVAPSFGSRLADRVENLGVQIYLLDELSLLCLEHDPLNVGETELYRLLTNQKRGGLWNIEKARSLIHQPQGKKRGTQAR